MRNVKRENVKSLSVSRSKNGLSWYKRRERASKLFVLTFAVSSLLPGAARARGRVVVDWMRMVLHDEVWRELSVLRRRRRRKRIGSLLQMRSSAQTDHARRQLVPRRWRQWRRRRRPGDNRGSHDGGTVTDGLAISMRGCVCFSLQCARSSAPMDLSRLQLADCKSVALLRCPC